MSGHPNHLRIWRLMPRDWENSNNGTNVSCIDSRCCVFPQQEYELTGEVIPFNKTGIGSTLFEKKHLRPGPTIQGMTSWDLQNCKEIPFPVLYWHKRNNTKWHLAKSLIDVWLRELAAVVDAVRCGCWSLYVFCFNNGNLGKTVFRDKKPETQ